MHLATTLLVFGMHRINAFYCDAYHGLVADLPRQFFIANAPDVEVGVTAVDAGIGRRRLVAKGLFEAANLGPPPERFSGVGGRQYRNCTFDDCFHKQSIKDVYADCLARASIDASPQAVFS